MFYGRGLKLDKNAVSLIKGYLERAEEKLKSAKDLFKDSDWSDCVSRAYYCVFHAAQAVLLSQGLNADTHQGVLNLFGLHFVKEGNLDKRYARILSQLKDERENSDYEVFCLIERETAENAVSAAEDFLTGMRQYLAVFLKE
jgi:hypothetical protein